MNKYWLKTKKMYSPVSDIKIQEMFEDRQSGKGFNDFSENGPKGTYTDELLQGLWEEYYNGFRDGEDYVRED